MNENRPICTADNHQIFLLKRPYKEDSPQNTINRIRSILTELNLLTYESYWGTPYNNIHSCRIETGPEFGKFGTNGKGVTKEYCLASAYGEFLERIQNSTYLLNLSGINLQHLKNSFGFYCFPDESIRTKEEILQLDNTILKDLFGNSDGLIDLYFDILKEKGINGCIAVPYEDCSNRETVYLPYNLLIAATGSNGMAAGNTLEEAMAQSLFEIIERWTASIIFFKRLCPPTVPRSFLEEFTSEISLIHEIEKDGFHIEVKDFSAGLSLPSLGVLLYDRSKNKYQLNVGSDSSFQVALNRCLTEIFQGISNNSEMESRMITIGKQEPSFFTEKTSFATSKLNEEFVRFTENGIGNFPYTLFGNVPNYAFDPSIYEHKNSYKNEVKSLISTLENKGVKLFFRNLTFFGFPTCHIYSPSVSSVGGHMPKANNNFNKNNIKNIEFLADVFRNSENADREQIEEIANILSKIPKETQFMKLLYLSFDKGTKMSLITVSFIEFAIWFYLEEFKKAHKAIIKSIKCSQGGIKKYHIIISHWLEYLLIGIDDDLIEKKLIDNGISKKLVENVRELLSDPNTIFSQIQMPKCPQCMDCAYDAECKTSGHLRLATQLFPAMRQAPILLNNKD